jgi:hypothetical protein
MSRTLIVFTILGSLFCGLPCSSPTAQAEELHDKFLEGLRERGYYDYALYYLDTLEARTDVGNEVKQLIPYQRAVTLLAGASTINNPEQRDEQLDRAVAQLEAFTRANPDHALAGNANTELARIQIEKARVRIWESESPANKDNNEKYRLEARGLLTKARGVFQKAHDQHKAAFDQFPKFIPQEEAEKLEARGKAEIAYMRAQIDLGLCTYEEAQTHPRGSQEFKNLLTKAADEFKVIHEKYRSMVGGLYSRMWQGKCFEEMEDIGKALGIYNELLAHPGTSLAMQNVQNQVLQFRLICLNHDQRKDYQLVISEAEDWLGKNRKLHGYSVGLGIRFQKAIAHEKLAEKLEKDYEAALNEAKRNMEKKEPQKPTAEIESNLRKAIQDAQEVTKYAGQYKAPSQFMVSRVKGKMGLDEGEPKNIEEALARADRMRQEIEDLEAKIAAAATKQETTNAEEALGVHLNETARVLTLALKLADEKTDIVTLNTVRFLLSYVYYKLHRNYEAGVVGEYIASRFANLADDDGGKLNDLAQKGATVARAAYFQEYEAKRVEQESLDESERNLDFELDQMVRVCVLTTKLWPTTGLADDSRMTLGRIYSKRDQPAEAAKWFIEVTSPELKGLAKVSAGQAYWNAYLNGIDQPLDKRPKTEDLASWQQNAKKHLDEGLKSMNGEIPEDASVDDATDLILARVTLAQINVYEQNYDEAIRFLTEAKPLHHPPLAAVKIADGEDRPERGVKSQKFASLVYQVLLRAYVGKQKTDEALNAMKDLENIVGTGNTAELSNTYRELGEQIGKEVKRLQAEGPKERLDSILLSFNTFLNALFEPERRKSMTVGSLQWMGETFLSLGVSLKDSGDPASKAKVAEYFKKAEECYQSIIDRGNQEDPKPKWLTGMKLRLADASRVAGNYENGLKTIEEVLKEYPEAPNVQSAAAQLLEDWGASGQADAPQRLIEAIQGRSYEGQPSPNRPGIKGWIGLTTQYDMLLRPIRAQLRDLRNAEEAIIAYENTLKEHAARLTQVESAKALNQDVQYAEAELAKITDALAAGKTWLELNAERDKLEDQPATGKDAEKARLERISQINRFTNHMIDSQYYEKLTSGAIKEGYEKEIAKLQGKADADSVEKLARSEGLLKEIEQEETLLAPAFRTGQRIVNLREQIAVLLQKEYDQLDASASVNPGSQTLLETLKRQIEAVKPASLDEARAGQVQAELEALGKEGRGRSKEDLQQELKVLRNAVNAWTTYDLVKSEVTVPLAELKLDDETLRAKLAEKKTLLGQQIAAEEAKETDYQARLMEVLHHVADARYKYAKAQSSNVEKEKALRTAEREATGLTQRIPRADISNEWWTKFNTTYKAIREDLQPFIKQGETIDPAQEIPVPPQVVAGLTWLERPSNVAVATADSASGTAASNEEKAAEASESGGGGTTLIIVSVLLVLGLAGGAIYMVMGPQKKKKPVRAAVAVEAGPFDGAGDPFAFAEGLDEPAPKEPAQPRPVKRTATAAQRPAETAPKPRSGGATSADAPRKAAPKKRPPEAAGEAPKPKPKPRPPE